MYRVFSAKPAILAEFQFVRCRSLILGGGVIPSFAITTGKDDDSSHLNLLWQEAHLIKRKAL